MEQIYTGSTKSKVYSSPTNKCSQITVVASKEKVAYIYQNKKPQSIPLLPTLQVKKKDLIPVRYHNHNGMTKLPTKTSYATIISTHINDHIIPALGTGAPGTPFPGRRRQHCRPQQASPQAPPRLFASPPPARATIRPP